MEILRKRKEHHGASRVFLWGSLMALFTSFAHWFYGDCPITKPEPCCFSSASQRGARMTGLKCEVGISILSLASPKCEE